MITTLCLFLTIHIEARYIEQSLFFKSQTGKKQHLFRGKCYKLEKRMWGGRLLFLVVVSWPLNFPRRHIGSIYSSNHWRGQVWQEHMRCHQNGVEKVCCSSSFSWNSTQTQSVMYLRCSKIFSFYRICLQNVRSYYNFCEFGSNKETNSNFCICSFLPNTKVYGW